MDAKFLDFIFAYFVIQLGYAAIMSVAVYSICMLIRTVWPKSSRGLRLIIWTPMLLVPLFARLRAYYEVSTFVKTIYRWHCLISEYPAIKYVYILGCVAIFMILIVRSRKLHNLRKCAQKREYFGKAVYIIPFDVGAFSMGIFCPRIILSESMVRNCNEKELKGIILHEETHIKSGHIVMLTVWNIFRILFWINPFLHFGMKYFKEDIEHNCDMKVLERKELNPYEYGSLLLKQVKLWKNTVNGNITSFQGERGFKQLCRRTEGIKDFRSTKKVNKVILYLVAAAFLIGSLSLLKGYSYPRYTKLEEISVTNDRMETLLLRDKSDLTDVIEIKEDYIVVNRDALKDILPGGNDSEWLFISFGGYLKIPGIGGCADGVFLNGLSEKGTINIPYVATENDIMTQIVKWI